MRVMPRGSSAAATAVALAPAKAGAGTPGVVAMPEAEMPAEGAMAAAVVTGAVAAETEAVVSVPCVFLTSGNP